MIRPPAAKSFFLFGPRGTGKTTWVKSAFTGSIYIDLLEAEIFNDLTARPQRLASFIPPQFRGWIIIDEVQRVPELLHEVHRLIESKAYLEEEIRQEGLSRNLSAFARFLEAASFSQGSVLNIAAVARECAVQRKVVENYFSILEDLMIAYRIPVFSKKAKRRLVVHPKFYFFDAGVYRTLRPMGPLDAPEEAEGIALETLFLQEVMALNRSLDLGYSVYYWRTSNGREVDFVLYGPRGILAFEIKRTARLSTSLLGGLKSFLADYPMAKASLVYMGGRRYYEGGIEVIPAREALEELRATLARKK